MDETSPVVRMCRRVQGEGLGGRVRNEEFRDREAGC